MADVPDGQVDPDTGHCRAAMDGDCTAAAAASFLFAAGVVTTEKHMHYGQNLGGPDGSTASEVIRAVSATLCQAAIMAGAPSPWLVEVAYAFNPAAELPRAMLVGYVKPDGNAHMVCVVCQDGVWLHDPAEDERSPIDSRRQIAALKPNLVISLVPRKAAA